MSHIIHLTKVTTVDASLEKNGVGPDEAREALVDGWARRRRDPTQERPAETNYEVLGRTREGRYLQLVAAVTAPRALRIFHGRDMTDAERARYKRKRG